MCSREREVTAIEEKQMIQIDLLTPLTGEFYPDKCAWDDEEYDPEYGEPLEGADLVRYEDAITEMVERENQFEGTDAPCNLMDYFNGSPSIQEKVSSAVVSVKLEEEVLYGCTTLKLYDFLESNELNELCEYITGQYSDGWGEGFEQRDIKVDGGTLNIHFWQSGSSEFQCFKPDAKAYKPKVEEKKSGKQARGEDCR